MLGTSPILTVTEATTPGQYIPIFNRTCAELNNIIRLLAGFLQTLKPFDDSSTAQSSYDELCLIRSLSLITKDIACILLKLRQRRDEIISAVGGPSFQLAISQEAIRQSNGCLDELLFAHNPELFQRLIQNIAYPNRR